MSTESRFTNLGFEADKAASRCAFCQQYGHTVFECVRSAVNRIEHIEVGIAEMKLNPWAMFATFVMGGIVGGIVGAFAEAVMRGIW